MQQQGLLTLHKGVDVLDAVTLLQPLLFSLQLGVGLMFTSQVVENAAIARRHCMLTEIVASLQFAAQPPPGRLQPAHERAFEPLHQFLRGEGVLNAKFVAPVASGLAGAVLLHCQRL